MSTIRRGRILRDTSAGEGLVFVQGSQYPFRLEGMWRSEYSPKVNMPVDVEFDDQDKIVAVSSVNGQAVVGEHAAQALGAAQESAKKIAAEFQAKGLPVIQEYAQRIGYPTLAALGAVIIAWFFMPAASIDAGFLGKNSVTFYQSLKFLNSGAMALQGGGAGIYGLLCFLALIAVLLPQFWNNRRAGYGMAAPLILMVLVVFIAYFKASSQFSGGEEAVGNAEYQAMMREMAEQAAAEMRKAVSIGFGTWLAFIAGAYLAWQGWTKVRAARG